MRLTFALEMRKPARANDRVAQLAKLKREVAHGGASRIAGDYILTALNYEQPSRSNRAA